MKMRVCQNITGCPVLEIIPQNGNFDGWQALVEVRFFAFDDDGRKVYKPCVKPNIYFNETTPEEMREWGDIFAASAMIARNNAAVMFLAAGCSAEILEVWGLVADVQNQMKLVAAQHPAPAAQVEP